VTIYHLIKSSPLDLERVETRNKWSLRMACGRLEATEMWVLSCHSLVRHGLVIPNITFSPTTLNLLMYIWYKWTALIVFKPTMWSAVGRLKYYSGKCCIVLTLLYVILFNSKGKGQSWMDHCKEKLWAYTLVLFQSGPHAHKPTLCLQDQQVFITSDPCWLSWKDRLKIEIVWI
jgi:hypothetical protein